MTPASVDRTLEAAVRARLDAGDLDYERLVRRLRSLVEQHGLLDE